MLNEESSEKLKFKAQVQDNQIIMTLQKNQQFQEFSFFPYIINPNKEEEIRAAIRTSSNLIFGYNYLIINSIKHVKGEGQCDILLKNGGIAKLKLQQNDDSIIEFQNGNIVNIKNGNNIYKSSIVLRDDKYDEEKRSYQFDAYFIQDSFNLIVGDGCTFIEENKSDQQGQQNQIFQYQQYQFNQVWNDLLSKNQQRIKTQGLDNQLTGLLEITFVLDTTGSMNRYIDKAKDVMKQIIQTFEENIPSSRVLIKFGFVLYRDHQPMDNTYVTKVYDLNDIDKSIQFIQGITSGGGGDTPEAVIDGLYQSANGIKWTKQSNIPSMKFVIHIGDAPPHGKQYSNEDDNADWAETGGPSGIQILDVAQKFSQLEISYKLIKIGSNLEKTAEIFRQYLKDYDDVVISNQQQLTNKILNMIKKDLLENQKK